MKDDLLLRLRQKVVRTDNNGQSYAASRNIDGDEAADEIERLIAELAAAKRDLTEAAIFEARLRSLLREARDMLGGCDGSPMMRLRARIDTLLEGDR